MNNQIKEMRARIIEFVKLRGGEAERIRIKQYLELDPAIYSECFNRAVKTKKLEPVYGSGHVGSGLFLRVKPAIAYKLT